MSSLWTRRACALAWLALAAACAPARTVLPSPAPADPRDLRAAERTAQSVDSLGFEPHLAADAVMRTEIGDTIVGVPRATSHLQALQRRPGPARSRLGAYTREVAICTDRVVQVGTYWLGDEFREFVALWRDDADGTWRIHSLDLAPPETRLAALGDDCLPRELRLLLGRGRSVALFPEVLGTTAQLVTEAVTAEMTYQAWFPSRARVDRTTAFSVLLQQRVRPRLAAGLLAGRTPTYTSVATREPGGEPVREVTLDHASTFLAPMALLLVGPYELGVGPSASVVSWEWKDDGAPGDGSRDVMLGLMAAAGAILPLSDRLFFQFTGQYRWLGRRALPAHEGFPEIRRPLDSGFVGVGFGARL